MKDIKNIALVAHDSKKKDLINWVKKHYDVLKDHNLFATGTTGEKLEELTNIEITKFKSGPIGGDQQIGAAIVEGKINILIFFWDPLKSQPHDPDVKALLRVAALWDVVVACNESTANFVLQSNLMNKKYQRNLDLVNSYTKNRDVKL